MGDDERGRTMGEKITDAVKASEVDMQTAIHNDPKVLWQMIRAEWMTNGVIQTARECLKQTHFGPVMTDLIIKKAEAAAREKLSRRLCEYVRSNPGEILELERELNMTAPEFAAAIGMPYEELEKLTDEYFGGAP